MMPVYGAISLEAHRQEGTVSEQSRRVKHIRNPHGCRAGFVSVGALRIRSGKILSTSVRNTLIRGLPRLWDRRIFLR
jgi:hypothetical protein